MNITALLERLARDGIRVAAKADRLAVSSPDGALTDDVKDTIRAHREEILQFLREYREEEARRQVRIERVDRTLPLPASYAQQRLWLIEQTATELPVYNMYFAYELRGALDEAVLREAVAAVTARHEVLRTALVEADDGLRQVIDERCAPVFERHEAGPESIDDTLFAIVSTRFDLAVAPLIRFDLVRTGPRRWVFVVTQHHVISDGWSTGLLRNELSECYTARLEERRPRLPDLPVQYADYAVWEREWLGSELAQQQREYWRQTLAQLPPVLDLVPSRPRLAVQHYRGSAFTSVYDAQFLRRAKELCARTGTTLYSAFAAAYSLLLSRLSRSDDIALGSPLANRPYPVLENSLGLFFNSITLRNRIDEQQTVRDFLTEVRRTAFEAFAHQDLPFDQVVQAVAAERSSSHSPVFQTIFILQSYPDENLTFPGVEAEPADTPVYSAQYDLLFKLREDGDELHALLVYDTTLWDADDARRFVAWFRHLVERMCAAPDARLGELPLIDPAEAADIARWNARTVCPVPPAPVHALIRDRLAEEPDQPALTFRGTTLSRGDVARMARAVAAGLAAAGLRPGQRVGVLMPRTPKLVAVLLGIMSAGLVYVPLDGAAPTARVETMLDTARCTALVTGEPYGGECPGFTGARIDAAGLLDTRGVGEPVTGTDSAYVIFTSGSTGLPKGVEISHANLAHLFTALDRAVPLPEDAVWLSVTGVTFDIAVVELLWTLARGIPVVLAETSETLRNAPRYAGECEPATVPELILGEKATAMQATPTLLRGVLQLSGGEEALRSLRLLMVGGETLDTTLARRLKALGIPKVLNMYGPTETTVWSTCWEVPDRPEKVLIGKPLANTAAYVVDAALHSVPVGMYGELVLAGAGVAQGYVGDRQLTEARFPVLASVPGEGRVYRTGDVARLLPGGHLELVGRMDNQVKVNGYRIELEEIEQAVNALPAVAECAVTVKRTEQRSVLVAHCVPREGHPLDPETLRAGLAEVLPDQMLPAVFVTRTSLPTTASGKTDRRALPPVPLDKAEEAPQEPTGELEAKLLGVWRSVLADDTIGPTADFFRSGGSSILVARLLTEVRKHVHADARIVDLFRFPSVRTYAAHLARGQDTGSESTAAPEAASRARRAAQLKRRQQVQRKQRLRGPGSGPEAV
ncbi:amino acid adenylation domain-containing protein [Streptomyces sp. NPDC039022]|uniref:non-ribosomal peptide synthetase n=1 Tax=Streptomyces sp. NPDC039022 TaxID=3157091 RepID=UPI00340A9BFA